jgi:hypothetical protein
MWNETSPRYNYRERDTQKKLEVFQHAESPTMSVGILGLAGLACRDGVMPAFG